MPRIEDELTGASYNELDGGDKFVISVDGIAKNPSLDEVRKFNNCADINSQTGTSYTLGMTDGGKTIFMANAASNTLTVPPSSSVDFPIGTQIAVWRMGAGSTTIVAGSGVTINTASDDLAIAAQYSAGVLLKIGTDSWVWSSGGAAGSSLPALSTPASLTMTADGENDMDFSWGNVSNESGFEVQIAEDASFTVNVQTANKSANVTTHSFTGLTEGTTYYGRVKAEGDGVTYSDSGYATDTEATDDSGLLGLNVPTSFTATVDGSDIDLAWTDTNSSPNETGLEIRRNTTNTTVGSTLINSPAANATSYTDVAPGVGTWYYFVKAKGDGVTTGDSGNASANATIAAGNDADAQAFFDAAGVTLDGGEEAAINDWFVALKAASIYTKGVAAYFPISETWLNAFNPLNTDGAFRGTVSGTALSYDAGGATFNGTNNHVDTHIIPATHLAAKSECWSWYNSINSNSGVDYGGVATAVGGSYFLPSDGTNLTHRLQAGGDGSIANTTSNGRWLTNVRDNGDATTYQRRILKNGSVLYNNAVNSGVSAAVPSTVVIYIGADNNDGTPNLRRNGKYPFFFCFDGLTNIEEAALDAANAQLQSDLGL